MKGKKKWLVALLAAVLAAAASLKPEYVPVLDVLVDELVLPPEASKQ